MDRTRAIELIAFDGDDTLWHNERSFQKGRERFRSLLGDAGVAITDHDLDAVVNRIEVGNLEYYGYGVSSFVLSLIEASIELTDGRVTGNQLHGLIELAKHMLTEEIELLPGVREVVATLAGTHPLMLVTKGDLLHQTSKLDRSGLREYFRYVEVVSEKTTATYARILSRHGIEPARFLMIGNSIRSDVLPVLEAGGWAAQVPAELSWSHEHAELPARARPRYFDLPALDRVVDIVERMEGGQSEKIGRS